MNPRIFFGLLVLFLISGRAYAYKTANVEFVDVNGNKIGKALLTETDKGIEMGIEIEGLPQGPHAIHIHENGVCTPPDFKSAGAHFNPEGKKHGRQNPEGHHAGDLPNLYLSGEKEMLYLVIPGLTLSQGPKSVLKEGGTSVVIHASEDDHKTDPSGNSGDRIACGVIA